MRQIRFRADGQSTNETDTPAQLEMEAKDRIDALQRQTGAGYLKETSTLLQKSLL